MKKEILISIRPKYVTDILNRKKTIEIRKSIPDIIKDWDIKKDETINVYIYCTKKPKVEPQPDFNGMVVAKFQLIAYEEIECDPLGGDNEYFTGTLPPGELLNHGCLDFARLNHYLKGKKGFAWYISNLKIFEKPIPLSEFQQPRNSRGKVDFNTDDFYIQEVGRAPQSWCYVLPKVTKIYMKNGDVIECVSVSADLDGITWFRQADGCSYQLETSKIERIE